MDPRLEVLDAWPWYRLPSIHGLLLPQGKPDLVTPSNNSSSMTHNTLALLILSGFPWDQSFLSKISLARWGCLLATWKQNNIIHPLNNCPAQETYLLFCLPFPGAPTYASSDGLEVEDIRAHFQLLNVIFLMILEKLIDHLELVAYQSKN